jgi:hypothetical protein
MIIEDKRRQEERRDEKEIVMTKFSTGCNKLNGKYND